MDTTPKRSPEFDGTEHGGKMRSDTSKKGARNKATLRHPGGGADQWPDSGDCSHSGEGHGGPLRKLR